MKFINILHRFREPSTWAGVSVLLTLFGVPPGVPEALGQIVAGAAAISAVLIAERGQP